MGLGASLFKDCEEQPVSKEFEQYRGKKNDKKEKAKQKLEALKKVADQFTSELLDEAYLHSPLRRNIIEESSLYPSDLPE